MKIIRNLALAITLALLPAASHASPPPRAQVDGCWRYFESFSWADRAVAGMMDPAANAVESNNPFVVAGGIIGAAGGTVIAAPLYLFGAIGSFFELFTTAPVKAAIPGDCSKENSR